MSAAGVWPATSLTSPRLAELAMWCFVRGLCSFASASCFFVATKYTRSKAINIEPINRNISTKPCDLLWRMSVSFDEVG